jgi:phosphoglycerate kinase
MDQLSLQDLGTEQLRGQRVVVRADFNVPLDEERRVTDDTRIRMTLPTLEALVGAGARVVLLSHLGRPKGAPDPAFSLRPAADRLGELLEAPVTFCPDTIGEQAQAAAGGLVDGAVLVMENTRFLPGETANEPATAEAMADLGDLFVNDAFGTAHRAHASTEGVARVIRDRGGLAVAGFLIQAELEFLGRAMDDPERPFVAVMGGAKISGKIDVIDALLPRVDRLIIGGAMANTFFRALGLATGRSLVEEDRIDMALELMDRAGDTLLLPVDCVVAGDLSADASARVSSRDEVTDDELIADIGPATVSLYSEAVGKAETVLWNGPMGVFEMAPFAAGTLGVAEAIAAATDRGATTVVGGGDSAAAAEVAGVTDRMSHISTGGGASLEFLAGEALPGVEALSTREDLP